MVPRADPPASDPSSAGPAPALPPLEEILAEAVVVSLPLRTRFRGQSAREAMLLRGPVGWGEFAPFPEYQAPETSPWLASAVESAWCGLSPARRDRIPISATLPAVPPEQVESVLRGFGDLGRTPAVKIKVAEAGQSLADDVARFREAARLLPQAGLRADANAGWDHEQALRALSVLAEECGERIEYIEQPVPGVEGLAALREALDAQGIGLRIAADEAVRKAEDPLRVARLGAADLIVVKAPPLGGVHTAAEVVRASGMDAVVSSALDTSVGLAAGLALAARLEHLPYACGLGTAALLADDVVAEPLIPRDGALPVPTRDGAAVTAEPEPELLERHRVSPQRHQWWEERVRAAYAGLMRMREA